MRHEQARSPTRSRSPLCDTRDAARSAGEVSRTGCVTYGTPLRVSASPREPRAAAVGRRGFTLVEMLVVVAIIGILASTLLGALFVATEHARAERTKSLISKLHNQMMQRWEEYETRRMPLTIPPGTSPDDIALAQLMFLSELMRLELPDSYEDLQLGNLHASLVDFGFTEQPLGNPAGSIGRPTNYVPSLTRAYQQRIRVAAQALIDSGSATDVLAAVSQMQTDNQSAEMLYMIMKMAAGDEDSGGSHFSAKDEGDTDGDGMPEFLDAWGNPIEWIRWPAGFANEDTTMTRSSPPGWGLVTDLITGSPTDDPDPFDPRRVRISGGVAPTSAPLPMSPEPPVLFSFRLVPLIMSPGPDGEYGVAFRRSLPSGATADQRSDLRDQGSEPYYFWENSGGGEVHRRGMPIETNLTTGDFDPINGEWVHLDNITNHLTEAE